MRTTINKKVLAPALFVLAFVVLAVPTQATIIAYHDMGATTGEESTGNITTHQSGTGSSVELDTSPKELINYADGSLTGVEFSVDGANAMDARNGGETSPPDAGTPADPLFNVPGLNLNNGVIYEGGNGGEDATTYTLTGLNPAGLYDVAFYANRNAGADGVERFTLGGADIAVNSSSTGIISNFVTDMETRPNQTAGNVVRWTEINPGADGKITITVDPEVTSPSNIAYLSAMRLEGGIPILAASPNPGNGATDVLHDADLDWSPGIYAVKHNVYLGTSFEDVNTTSAEVLVGDGLDANSLDVGSLTFGQTYYWRVDEVNGAPDFAILKGNVWSFEVEPYSIPIAGSEIIATASSASNEESLPENTLNGSGLDANDMHTITTETMWFTAMGDATPWIQYEFDGVKKLDTMTVWNSNSSAEGFIGYGVKGVLIEYSVDGQTWDVFEDVNEFSRAPGLRTYNQYDEINLAGLAAKMVRLNIQSNWGGVMQSYSLSEVQFSMIPTAARTPVPESGSVDMLPDTVVSWRAGREAVQSVVYLSTDANEVADGIAASATSNTNSISLSSFDLQMGTTYYWRVDEVNEVEVESVWAGPVWSFSTVATIVVDDFESYSNDSPDRPFQAWLDGFGYSADEFFPAGYGGNGTGAAIGHDIWSGDSTHYNGDIMETGRTIAGSNQSMPFYYSNSGTVASETKRTFAVPQDWTVGGAKTLSIPFAGTAGNTGTLYVKINGVKVTYPRDPGNLALGGWLAFNIDLTSMDVQAVTTLQIGMEGADASGMILIDNIKLYAMVAGELITPTEPDTANLAGHWMFDESSGATAADSSGNNNYGTVMGDAQWVAGKVGGALAFDGVDDMVVVTQNSGLPIYNNGTNNAYSVAMWIKGGPQNNMRIFSEGSTTSNTPLLNLGTKDSGQFDSYIRPEAGTTSNHPLSQAEPFDDSWHHIAWVDANGTATLYIDGLADGGNFNYTRGTMALDTTSIGGILRADPSHWFTGQIDEVRVYNRALSAGEALWLAGVTDPIDKPF